MLYKSVIHKIILLLTHNNAGFEYEGIIKSSSILMQLNSDRTVKANTRSQELVTVNGGNMGVLEHYRVLDLNNEGERWEGNVINNQPSYNQNPHTSKYYRLIASHQVSNHQPSTTSSIATKPTSQFR